MCCEGCCIHALKPWATFLASRSPASREEKIQTLESTGTCFLLHIFRIRVMEPEMNEIEGGNLPENNACTKQVRWSPRMKDSPASSMGPAHSTLCALLPTPHIFSSLCRILLPPPPLCTPFLFSSRPPDPWEGGLELETLQPGAPQQPSQCLFPVIFISCNLRDR